MARDAKGRITYEMKSVGDAFQDHLEKHHNISAVTPVWLDALTDFRPKKVSAIKEKAQAIKAPKRESSSKEKSPVIPSL